MKVELSVEDGTHVATIRAIPGARGEGSTQEEAIAGAMRVALETLASNLGDARIELWETGGVAIEWPAKGPLGSSIGAFFRSVE